MRNNTDHGHFFEVGVAAALEFLALVRTPLDTSNSEPLLLLMMEGKSRTDVATLPRRNFETSRRCDVVTWGRSDVGTSQRWNVATLQPLSCIASTYPICFQSLLFSIHLHVHSPNHPYYDIELDKYIFNLKIMLTP